MPEEFWLIDRPQRWTLGEIADGVAKLAREKLEQAPFRLPPLNPMSAAPGKMFDKFIVMLWDGSTRAVEVDGNGEMHAITLAGMTGERVSRANCLGWWPAPEVREG